MFDGIYEAIHRELDGLNEKYAAGTQMSGKDLEDIDLMAHALKSLAAYEAMGTYDRGEPFPKDRSYRRRY